MPSPRFERRSYGTAVSFANHYTGGVAINTIQFIIRPSIRKSSREVGGKGREVRGPDHSQVSSLSQNWGGKEPNRTVTCMVLKATANDRRHLALCHDEFRGPRSGLCRSGSISNNNS
ncbi:uncharacterized protein TNCV_2339371 [Trichonephila clavipes]|nr:uncharacterized protein TNCV_2339371 [Trichonephila clavipes]